MKKLKLFAFKRSLATDSRLASRHTCEACKELKGHDNWSTTGKKIQFGLEVISRLKLTTRSSREAKSPECDTRVKHVGR